MALHLSRSKIMASVYMSFGMKELDDSPILPREYNERCASRCIASERARHMPLFAMEFCAEWPLLEHSLSIECYKNCLRNLDRRRLIWDQSSRRYRSRHHR